MAQPKLAGTAVAGLVVELAVNVALPYAVFTFVQPRVGDVRALLWSSVPPIARSAVELVRKRRVDAISLFVVGGIALGLLAFVGGGSVKLVQLRENLVTGLIGCALLGSAAIKRPLMYQLARATMSRRSPEQAAEFERLQTYPGFRRTMFVMTVVWGLGLVGATSVACALVYLLSIKAYLVVGPIVGNAIIGVLALWTLWYARAANRLMPRT